jgi:hypothetical protein
MKKSTYKPNDLLSKELKLTRDDIKGMERQFEIWNNLRTQGFIRSNNNPILRRTGPLKVLYRLVYLILNLGRILETQSPLFEQTLMVLKKIQEHEERLGNMVQDQENAFDNLQNALTGKRKDMNEKNKAV